MDFTMKTKVFEIFLLNYLLYSLRNTKHESSGKTDCGFLMTFDVFGKSNESQGERQTKKYRDQDKIKLETRYWTKDSTKTL